MSDSNNLAGGGIGKLSKKNMLIIGVCGVALIGISVIPAKESKVEDNKEAGILSSYSGYAGSSDNYVQNYIEYTQGELEEVLSKIPGASPVSVMISVDTSNVSEFAGKGQLKVEGVLVVTGSKADASTIMNINEAVKALFGVEAHKIKVIKG